MLTGKQRSYLKSMANTMDPVLQLGKNGITDSFVKQAQEILEIKELIKIKVLNNSLLEADEVAHELTDKLNCEFVQSIGNKIIIYKESEEDKKIQLPK